MRFRKIGLVAAAAMDDLIEDALAANLGSWSYHNPRRVKRILNAVILNYRRSNTRGDLRGFICEEILRMYPEFVEIWSERQTAVRDVVDYLDVGQRYAKTSRRTPSH
jgi:hypothetical protein